MRTTLSSILAILTLSALFLSACGNSNGAGNTTGPITVGELFPMTGREPFVGDWFNHGGKVGITEVNNNGGVMGRQLSPVLADTAGDAVDAVTALKNLQTHNPTFIIGPSSLEIEAVINQFDPAHLPDFVEGGTTQLDHMTNKYVYRTTASDSTLAIGMDYYALNKLNCTNAGLFFESTSNAAGIVDPLTKAYTAHGGTVVDTELVTPHQSSYRTEVEKLFANNPGCIFAQTDPQTAATFYSDVVQLGHMNVPFIMTDSGADINMAKAMGLQYASKWMTGMNGSAPTGQGWTHFTQIYNQVWGTDKPVTLSQNTYDSVIIACLAMTAAKSTDPTVWINYVNKVTDAGANKTVVYTYADGVAALKAGKDIKFSGASGDDIYNQYHNVAGGWDVVQWDPTGTTDASIYSISQDQVAAWTPSN